MKKLLTTILCFVLALSIVPAMGCDNSVFNANYQQVQASEITAFNSSLGGESNEIMGNGIKIEMSSNEHEANEYEKFNLSYQMIVEKVDGKDVTKLSGKINEEEKENGKLEKEQSELYYDGQTLYSYTKTEGKAVNGEFKYKMDVPSISQYIAGITELFRTNNSGYMSLDSVMAKYASDNGVKFFMETTDNGTKIKIEFTELEDDDMDEIINGKVYFVYDANKVLTALKVEIKETSLFDKNEYEEINVNVEAWSGNISAPKDLDKYTTAPA